MAIKKDAYLETLDRMEPDIAMVDTGAALASISISLRRIADALETLVSYGRDDDANADQK